MLVELQTKDKIVGIKQLKKALAEGRIQKVFAADDADPKLLQPILEQCREKNIPVEQVPTMAQLGKACGIEVGAAVAALLL
jgi:large subunit ribosomal protein L7A